MTSKTLIRYAIAAVWLVNGLVCKVLHGVPRHEAIVAKILGQTLAPTLTMLIGIAEIVMTIWIISRYLPRLNALTQIGIIGAMNVLEFFLAPELLLWGHLNIVFAAMFMVLIYWNAFGLKTAAKQKI